MREEKSGLLMQHFRVFTVGAVSSVGEKNSLWCELCNPANFLHAQKKAILYDTLKVKVKLKKKKKGGTFAHNKMSKEVTDK